MFVASWGIYFHLSHSPVGWNVQSCSSFFHTSVHNLAVVQKEDGFVSFYNHTVSSDFFCCVLIIQCWFLIVSMWIHCSGFYVLLSSWFFLWHILNKLWPVQNATSWKSHTHSHLVHLSVSSLYWIVEYMYYSSISQHTLMFTNKQ